MTEWDLWVYEWKKFIAWWIVAFLYYWGWWFGVILSFIGLIYILFYGSTNQVVRKIGLVSKDIDIASMITALSLDNTAGGTDGLTTKAPTSNVMYDHGVATTGVHGAGANTILYSAHNVALSSTIHPNTSFADVMLNTSITDTLNTQYYRVELDTEVTDTGSNYSVAKWQEGASDAGSGATAIIDANPTTGTGFAAGMLYAKVSWHDGYGYITSVTNSTTLVIVTVNGTAITVGDVYTIYHNEYVCPTDGKYIIQGSLGFANVVTAQRYIIRPMVYNATTAAGATAAQIIFSQEAVIGAVSNFVLTASGLYKATAGDWISVFGYHTAGVTTVDVLNSFTKLRIIRL